MNATEVQDWILDWEYIDYWQGGWDSECGVEFVCIRTTELRRPDRRCKSGVRTFHDPCHYRFRDWSSIRELIREVQEHVSEAHPDVQNAV
jgi:hypothetical protein